MERRQGPGSVRVGFPLADVSYTDRLSEAWRESHKRRKVAEDESSATTVEEAGARDGVIAARDPSEASWGREKGVLKGVL